jgi:site-specific DNA recombinase
VWADIEAFLRDPGDVLAQLAMRMQGHSDRTEQMRDKLAGLKMALGAKQAERDVVVGLYRRGRIDAATLDRQLDQIAEEESELRAQIAEQEAILSHSDRAQADLRSADALLRESRARLDASPDFATRQDIARILVERVVVDTRTDERGHKQATVTVLYRFDPPHARTASPTVTTRTGRDSWRLRA